MREYRNLNHVPFPVISIEYVNAQSLEDHLYLKFRLTMSQSERSRYRLHTKLQLTYPGGEKRPEHMRVFLAQENCQEEGDLVTVQIPDYRSVWNLDLQEYMAYCKYTLIDTVTGYRNLAQEYSYDVKISQT